MTEMIITWGESVELSTDAELNLYEKIINKTPYKENGTFAPVGWTAAALSRLAFAGMAAHPGTREDHWVCVLAGHKGTRIYLNGIHQVRSGDLDEEKWYAMVFPSVMFKDIKRCTECAASSRKAVEIQDDDFLGFLLEGSASEKEEDTADEDFLSFLE